MPESAFAAALWSAASPVRRKRHANFDTARIERLNGFNIDGVLRM
jgi:hypothetical protein